MEDFSPWVSTQTHSQGADAKVLYCLPARLEDAPSKTDISHIKQGAKITSGTFSTSQNWGPKKITLQGCDNDTNHWEEEYTGLSLREGSLSLTVCTCSQRRAVPPLVPRIVPFLVAGLSFLR